MLWNRHCGLVLAPKDWFTIVIKAVSIHPFVTSRNSRKLESLRRSVALAISTKNALTETMSGLYKAEVTRCRGPWKNIEEVEYAMLEWVNCFNNRRLLESIGNVPPAKHEMMYYEPLEESSEAT